MKQRLAVLVLMPITILANCTDERCSKARYYCLSGQESEKYLQTTPDSELIKIAQLDYEMSKPPSGVGVYEMKRRGPDRAKAIFYSYAMSKTDKRLLDNMTRTFMPLGDVCGDWVEGAPASARKNLRASCGRVLSSENAVELQRSVDEFKKLRSP